MQLLNRAVMIVKPKQPLLDWINSLDNSDLQLEEIRQDCPAYLMPEIMNDDEQDIILAEFLPDIVENELAGWWQDESDWPQINDLETFKQWFEVNFHSMTFELGVEPLQYEAMELFAPLGDGGDLMGQYSEEKLADILDQVQSWATSFLESDHAKHLNQKDREAAEDIAATFAEIMYNYYLLGPEEWEPEELRACCLATIPRKVSADEAYFRSIAPVLSAFFAYLESEGHISNGTALARTVDEIGQEIVDRAADPENWGMAKALFAEAEEAGFDLTDEAEREQFMDEYNRQRLQEMPEDYGGTGHKQEQLGRNDPCPCGSGKKYKHCCGP